MSEEIGTLQPGARADVISVAGDPLADPWALEHVRLVMQDGVRVDERVQRAAGG